MNDHAKMFWLASYPKSGNTWMRSFISALNLEEQSNDEDIDDIDLNALRTGAIASGREWIERALGFSMDSLNADEIDALRPHAYRYINSTTEQFGYHKVHDAYSWVKNNTQSEPMFPAAVTRGALYLVRNPLDVCISYANHSSSSIDDAIQRMAKPNHAFCKTQIGQANQLRQWLWRWSDHVRSWQQAELPVKIVRYEDMKQNPVTTFTEVADFLQLPSQPDAILTALELTKFERLQAKEQASGFREKPVGVNSFFRKGIVGDWQNTLTAEQVDAVVAEHYEVMAELGYLP
ncbi:MAG: sulfotransferase domain-containing protein [Idiomarina sp.]|nr:sulfotransferase domain-containing protein [Idiomarina sp.]